MSPLSLFFIILYVSISLIEVCSCSDLYSDKVYKYDSGSFKKNIGGHVPHFVNFFAPWCGYCKRLKPVWDELAEKYNKDSLVQHIAIAKVDCTIETPICAEEGVSGYPSLIYYEAGELKGTKYQGKRDLLGLEEFIINSLKGEKKEMVPPIPDSIHSEQDAFVLTDDNFASVTSHGAHFVKFYAPWCGHCQRMAGSWAQLAQAFKHDKSITISKMDCTEQKKTCAEFEVKGYPTLLWIVNGKRVEKYGGARTQEGFTQFISDMKSAHEEVVTSDEQQKVAHDSDDEVNLVMELSGVNFDSAIADGFSFVKFHVPWCGHCKKLAPVWNQLAKKFAKSNQVKIAEIDCTQDESVCTEHKVSGYPTLFMFHKGKHITEYHGERTLERLHSFVLEHVHHTEL